MGVYEYVLDLNALKFSNNYLKTLKKTPFQKPPKPYHCVNDKETYYR